MRVGMVLGAPFPPDIRVEKEVGTLQREHELFLLCTMRNGAPATDEAAGMRITRVVPGASRRWATWRLMRSHSSRAWAGAIHRFIRENRLDALHVHDLPLAGVAIGAARASGIPVVLDLHEDYPAMLADMKRVRLASVPDVSALGVRLAASVPDWREYERSIVQRADRIIVVVEEAAARLTAIGADPSRVHVVSNYAPVPPVSNAAREYSGAVTAVYIGGFDQARDLATVVEAGELLAKRGCESVRIQLVGGSRRNVARMEHTLAARGISNVSVGRWIPRSDAEALVDRAQIGLVPHVRSPHTETTIPHKLFQYMARGLPVIVSDCAPLRRIVDEAGCGLVYEGGNAASLAEQLERLGSDAGLRQRLGDAGLSAAREKFNWGEAGKTLLGLYRGLEGEPDAPASSLS